MRRPIAILAIMAMGMTFVDDTNRIVGSVAAGPHSTARSTVARGS